MARTSTPPSPSLEVLGRVCDGRVRLERWRSPYISARGYLQGKHIRKSLGTANLRDAKVLATKWWQQLCLRVEHGEHIHSPNFSDCATQFLAKREKDAAAGLIKIGRAHV